MRPTLLLLLAATLAAAGCGSDDKPPSSAKPARPAVYLDVAAVEQAIVESIRQQRKVEALVACPGQVEQRKGVTFRCRADSKLGDATFDVTQTDDKGNVVYVAR